MTMSLREMLEGSKLAAAKKAPKPSAPPKAKRIKAPKVTAPPPPPPPPKPTYAFPPTWKVPTDPRRQHELHLWKEWKESGESPEKMGPLLTSLQPLINKQVRVFSRTPVPTQVIHSEATKHAIEALRKYNPVPQEGTAGTQIHSWVTGQLKGMNRYVYQNQNMRRITEERAQLVGDFQRANSNLHEQLGRAPTHIEIADHINEMPERLERTKKITAKSIKLLGQELTPDLLASTEMENPFVDETPHERELMKLIVYDLSPDELQVYEYVRGLNGKAREQSTGVIAKKLKWSASKVSQVKNKIAKKLEGYLNE